MRCCVKLVIKPKNCLECGKNVVARSGYVLRKQRYCSSSCSRRAAVRRKSHGEKED